MISKPVRVRRAHQRHQVHFEHFNRSLRRLEAPHRLTLRTTRESPLSGGHINLARPTSVRTITCNKRLQGRNLGRTHPEESPTPWGIRLGVSTSLPSKVQLSSRRSQAERGICRRTRAPAPL